MLETPLVAQEAFIQVQALVYPGEGVDTAQQVRGYCGVVGRGLIRWQVGAYQGAEFGVEVAGSRRDAALVRHAEHTPLGLPVDAMRLRPDGIDAHNKLLAR